MGPVTRALWVGGNDAVYPTLCYGTGLGYLCLWNQGARSVRYTTYRWRKIEFIAAFRTGSLRSSRSDLPTAWRSQRWDAQMAAARTRALLSVRGSASYKSFNTMGEELSVQSSLFAWNGSYLALLSSLAINGTYWSLECMTERCKSSDANRAVY